MTDPLTEDVGRLKAVLGADFGSCMSSKIACATASGALVAMRTDEHEVAVADLPPFLLRLFVPAAHRPRPRDTIHMDSRSESRAASPFLHPEPDLLVSSALPLHNIILNKFPVVFPHLLLCTKEYADQREHLSRADCAALEAVASTAYGSGDGPLCFYNSGENSGASQGHKHIQLVPRASNGAGTPYFLDALISRSTEEERASGRLKHFDFEHRFVVLDRTRSGHLHDEYTRLLSSLRIDTADGKGQHLSYNLLYTLDWLFIVPRKAECWSSVLPTEPPCTVKTSVNSLGFAGSILVREEAAFNYLRSVGPLPVLRSITFPIGGLP